MKKMYTLDEAKIEIRKRNKVKAKRQMIKQKIVGLYMYIIGVLFYIYGEPTCSLLCCTVATYIFSRDKFILF